MLGCKGVLTKAPIHAIGRIKAIQRVGFTKSDHLLIGILSKISGILADNKIGIFAISTFNTDYVLTKKENYQKALDVLKNAGYKIIESYIFGDC